MGVSFPEINQACPSSGLIRHDGKSAFLLDYLRTNPLLAYARSRHPNVEVLEAGRTLVVEAEIAQGANPPGIQIVGQVEAGDQLPVDQKPAGVPESEQQQAVPAA